MTVVQAAKALGISPSTVYGLCAKRKLKHYRFGNRAGKIVIEEADLEAYRKDQSVEVVIPRHNFGRQNPPIQLRHLRLKAGSP